HHVNLKLKGVRSSDLTPERMGSVYRGQQMVVFGHYWDAGELRIDLDAKVSGQDINYHTAFNLPEQASAHPEIERLWAFAKIQALKDEADLLDDRSDVDQAITDLAVEYGLVTENTSMVVMREQAFLERAIDRKNARRVATEHTAQQQRKQQAVKSSRVDTADKGSQPMYSKQRASHSGSGAFDIVWLILLMPACLIALFRAPVRAKD
ncbi:MAG: hypothetical protein KAG66_18805, partial [Methylococcales bacterium]|nr:hypothetical protein [Methylococcales bacterium]